MQWEQLSFFDPNYFYGSHPFDLRSNLESDPFLENLDPEFPINGIKPIIKAHQPSCRQQALEHILENIFQQDLPGKKYFEHYIRHKYRRNCKSNTLRQTATSLIQFLSFFRTLDKMQLERVSREDIEAFVESMQDWGLKPETVRTRLCAVYAFVRFLVEQKVVGYELMEQKIKLKLPDRLPRAIDPEDLKQLLSVADHIRDRALERGTGLNK